MQRIFVDHFKGSQPHQCLLMTVIQINRDISVINTRHISIEHSGCQLCKFLLLRHPIEESSITGDSQYLTIQTFDVTSGFRRMHTLHRTVGKRIITECHIPVIIIIVRHNIRQSGTAVSSGSSTCSRIAYGRIRSFLTARMVESFTFYIYLSSMRFPIHSQTRQQPIRPGGRQIGIFLRTLSQLIENILCPFFGLNQAPRFLLPFRCSQHSRMSLRHTLRQGNFLSGRTIEER